MRTFRVFTFLVTVLAASSALAATIRGTISDTTGAAITGARVTVRDIATRDERMVETDASGSFKVDVKDAGTYLVVAARAGFAEAARTVVIDEAGREVDASIALDLGALTDQVTVTANRSEREVKQIPLHVDSISKSAIEQENVISTGDALVSSPSINPVGNGPFGVRPRLRGLDSTRMLVLVDGERLNTARQATDRTGAEVGLVSPDAISRVEVINGAGTLMYGSDALSGTVNIITNEPTFSLNKQLLYGFNGYYSSNENGMRGTVTLGGTTPRVAFRVQAGAESFDNYKAGTFDAETTQPYFTKGTLKNVDTIDTNFGFNFGAFPDPFNRPFTRTGTEIPNSQAKGKFVNASSLIKLDDRRTVKVKYQSRRMTDIGFPDFADPYFFNATSLPYSNLDKVSAKYEARALTPWLANLSLSAYYQRTERLLRNQLPVQFPAPTPVAFFPITVFRLDILSDTEQKVSSPGIDLNAVLVPAKNHLLTTGVTFFRDGSSDTRTTSTTTSMLGQVALGARGPAAVVFPSAIVLGAPSIAHPVRVPDASFRDVAVFAQDEWRVRPTLSVMAGLRGDFYNVVTEATPGYDVQSVIGNATPKIDPSKLPNPNGATYARNALTGDIGLVSNPDGHINPFIRFGRSYRHPNLEEMLFAGPATTGSLLPNVTLLPETGNNFDAGVKIRAGAFDGGAFVFLNQYRNFIAQDLVVATNSSGALAQARNFGDVRIGGVELAGSMPFVFRPGVLTVSGSAAYNHGTVTDGTNPLNNASLAGTPYDNITPFKFVGTARYTQSSGRFWAEYGIRAQRDVTRVATTLLDSPFLIAQDLLSLQGFGVQRLGWGVNLGRDRNRLGLTFAIENLTDKFYREQFQFAPARGRSFTVGLNVGAF